jgi:hypothetical protein
MIVIRTRILQIQEAHCYLSFPEQLVRIDVMKDNRSPSQKAPSSRFNGSERSPTTLA